MKISKFRELYFKVGRKHGEKFAAAVEAALSDGWVRARKAEAEARRHDPGGLGWFYYCRDNRGGREPVLLAIYRRKDGTLYVANIVPLDRAQLTREQYNAALQEFHDKVLSRVKVKFPIVFAITSDK